MPATINDQVDIVDVKTQIKTILELGSAADADVSDFATAAQGTKADNAIPNSKIGAVNGVVPLDGAGKVDAQYLPVDGSFAGTWNATTNTPTIVSGSGISGQYYIVSVSGTTEIDGEDTWGEGDQIRFNGSVWQRIPTYQAVSSVNGKVGTVVLTATDISGISTVGKTGSYADLSGKPTLGTAAATNTTAYATAAQGTKADSALQPSTGVFRIDTFANASTITIPNTVKRVFIEDRLAHFKEVVSEPSHGVKFYNDGWWSLDELTVTPFMAGAIGNNVADDTTACAAIVQYAKLTGAPIYASDADFKTTVSIADLHNVVWFGPGRIWRGTNVWHVENGRLDTNVLYLSPTGNNANDGLGDGQPKATLQGALNDFANYGPTLRGKWKVQSAEGTYKSASAVVATIPFGL